MSSNEKFILAIDHGTSGAKTAIVSVHGEVIDWVFKEYPLYLFENAGAEQNPDEWWNAIMDTSKKLLDKELVPIENIVGISNTSQWSGTVPLDKDGQHLMNALIWMDGRGAKTLQNKLNKGFPKIEGYVLSRVIKFLWNCNGGPSRSGKDTLAHIMWLKDVHPEIYEKTYKFLEPQDWVNLKFTGKFASSFTTIQMHWITNIRDINNVHYSKSMLKMFKFDQDKFPKLFNTIDVLGPVKPEISDELGLNKDTKVILGAPDVHSCVIGGGAIDYFQGALSIGTSDFLLCHVPWKKISIAHNMASFPSPIPGKWLLMNEQEFAGGNLTFLRDNILYHKDELLREEKVEEVYQIFDKIVEKVDPGSNNVLFTPWIYGERAPVADYTVRGGLHNVSLDTTREHVIRAIFEGVAFNVRWLHMYIEELTKHKIDGIITLGGGAKSAIWCQIFSDILQRTIKQVRNPRQANACGAAFMASVGLGYIQWEDIPKYVKFSGVFKPNKENKAIYDKLFKEYVNIYNVSKKICKRLNLKE